MTAKLSETERAEALPPLEAAGWVRVEGRDAIAKTYRFANFVEAFGWMTRVGALGREARPPSRVVERLQDGRGDADHP
jgi:4a-hydroxytetrahydrobiopterin dehydratase